MLTLVETCQKVHPHSVCCSPDVVNRKLRQAFFSVFALSLCSKAGVKIFFFFETEEESFCCHYTKKWFLSLAFVPLGGKHAVFLHMLSFSPGICQIQRDDMSIAILFPLPFIVIVKHYALFIFSDSGSGAISENVHIESSRRVVNVDRSYDETSHFGMLQTLLCLRLNFLTVLFLWSGKV